MLKIAAIKGDGSYFINSVADDLEAYYSGKGEAPGEWMGIGAETLAASGVVEPDGFTRLLAGHHPVTGEPLAAGQGTRAHGPGSSRSKVVHLHEHRAARSASAPKEGDKRVRGLDLTFSAPKSVSLVWAFGDEQAKREVIAAIDAALTEGLGYLERHACVVRRGRQAEMERGGGFAVAGFRHRLNRNNEPYLHVHAIAANLTKRSDGAWRSLHHPTLFAHAKSAGYVFQAALRRELTQRLGVSWQPVRNGVADIRGISDEAIRVFSTRHEEILEYAAKRGEYSAAAVEHAQKATRRPKDFAAAPESLAAEWERRGAEVGFGAEQAAEVLGPGRTPERLRAADERVLRKLAAERNTFDRRDVVCAVAELAAEGTTAAEIEKVADRILARPELVRLDDPAILSRSDVAIVGAGEGNRRFVRSAPLSDGRYTTDRVVAQEHELLSIAARGRDAVSGRVEPAAVEQVIARRPGLTDEQERMVRRLLTGEGRVAIVQGSAGAGKTAALDAAREAWQWQGFEVAAVAPTWRAARQLSDATGLPASSLARAVSDIRAGYWAPPARSVVIIDEASMASTDQLLALLREVEGADGLAVVVGDRDQIPAVERGGAFRALVDRDPDPIRLSANLRQRDPMEREAVERLKAGEPLLAKELREEIGGYVVTQSTEDQRTAMIEDWWRAERSGEESLMIAYKRADVCDLNARAHQLMREAGRLGDAHIDVAGQEIRPGDLVVTRINEPSIGIANHERWRVVAIEESERKVGLKRLGDGHRAVLDQGLLERLTNHGGPPLEHGYAATFHSVEGLTAGRVLACGSEADFREAEYVALTRGTIETSHYVVDPDEPQRPSFVDAPKPPTWRDVQVQTSERSRDVSLATDQALQAQEFAPLTDPELYAARDRLASDLERARSEAAIRERAADALRKAEAEVAAAMQGRDKLATARAEAVRDMAAERIGQLGPPPATEHTAVRAAAADRETERRMSARIRGWRHSPPAWLERELGSFPRGGSFRDQHRWSSLARQVGEYRGRHSVRDRERALGAEPRELRARSEWRQLQARLSEPRERGRGLESGGLAREI
jgi:conjugative relaxase-like TrwC/TraI family protein